MKSILYKVSIIFLVSLSFISCLGSDNSSNDNNETSDKVKVYKYDGEIACISEGISLNEMSLELMNSNITVYGAQKNYDGLVYPSVCGESTGSINVYLIHKDDLIGANALGFESIDKLDNYIDKEY